jgi:uncharacterized membrane protein YedE/YeeE
MSAQDSAEMRFLGFATGLAFGSLLQRGRLARQDVILDQLLLQDHRVIKTMGTAVATGAMALYGMAKKGWVKKEIKAMKVGGIVTGAVLFGSGLALLGYCPGTGVSAAGAGRKDAVAGTLGMLMGAAIHVALFPKLEKLMSAGDFGKITVPELFKSREKAIA